MFEKTNRMEIPLKYRRQSVLDSFEGILIFTVFIGMFQGGGLFLLADKVPSNTTKEIQAGITVTKPVFVLLIIGSAVALTMTVSLLLPERGHRLTPFAVMLVLIFLTYSITLYGLFAKEIGIELVCDQNCSRPNFLVGVLAQATLLSLNYGFWIHKLEPDIPDSATKELELQLRKWERIIQIVLSVALVSGLAVSTQYFLNSGLGSNRILIIGVFSGPAIIALILYPVFKIHVLTEKIQRGLRDEVVPTSAS